MKTKDVYPSRYVTAEDLDKPINLTIENVVLEKVYDRQAMRKIQSHSPAFARERAPA